MRFRITSAISTRPDLTACSAASPTGTASSSMNRTTSRCPPPIAIASRVLPSKRRRLQLTLEAFYKSVKWANSCSKCKLARIQEHTCWNQTSTTSANQPSHRLAPVSTAATAVSLQLSPPGTAISLPWSEVQSHLDRTPATILSDTAVAETFHLLQVPRQWRGQYNNI